MCSLAKAVMYPDGVVAAADSRKCVYDTALVYGNLLAVAHGVASSAESGSVGRRLKASVAGQSLKDTNLCFESPEHGSKCQ